MRKLAIGLTSMLLLGGCGSFPKGPEVPNPFSIFQDNRSEAEKRNARIAKAYRSVTTATDARRVPGNRLQVSTRGGLPDSLNRLEDAFLIRAASETLQAGFDGFIIAYLDYEDSIFKFFNSPIETYPEAVEITTYEDFLVHTEEQNFFAARSTRSQKRVQGVVIMVNAEDVPDGQFFGARDTYDSLIEETRFKFR
jgi:hypothetical protein